MKGDTNWTPGILRPVLTHLDVWSAQMIPLALSSSLHLSRIRSVEFQLPKMSAQCLDFDSRVAEIPTEEETHHQLHWAQS